MPNPTRRTFLRQSAALSVAAAASGQQSAAAPPLRLWYTKPAAHWTEALPLGNGRIGAMVFGGPAAERFGIFAGLWAPTVMALAKAMDDAESRV